MVFGDFYRVYPYPGCPANTTPCGDVSPDGVRWMSIDTPHGRLIPWGVDTQTVAFWDPHIDKYVAYLRYNFYRKDAQGRDILPASRRIARTENGEFRDFPSPLEIAAPDGEDSDGAWGSGLYGTAATLYPGGRTGTVRQTRGVPLFAALLLCHRSLPNRRPQGGARASGPGPVPLPAG